MAVTLDSLRKAVKKSKGRSQALAWLADMERASGDYEAALKTVDAALAASPSDVPAMLVRAKILAGQQDFAGSIMEYKKVLAKDPFCLSAHKRMGESYDKLGKEAERNACFRRVHDMDPLDPFWKDEYDVLPEEDQMLAAPPMDDSSFTMDMDAENGDATEEDNIFANLAASLPNTDEEDNSSMEALRNSLDSVSDGNVEDSQKSEISDFDGHVLNSSEVSSAISGILGGDDDLDVADSDADKAPAAEELATSSLFSHFSDESEKAETIDEPKSEDVVEEKSDDTEFSLDSLDEPLEADEKATNVDDAFSSLLGDDELPEETSSAEPAAEVAEENLGAPDEEPTEQDNLVGLHSEGLVPTTHMDFSDEEDAGEPDVLNLDETPAAEESKSEAQATTVDDAFSSLLGDDELPEEKPVENEAPAESVEEKPLEESVEDSFGSLFEKSADADFSMNDDASSDAPAVEEPAQFATSATAGTEEKPAEIEENTEAETLAEPSEKSLEESVEDSFGSLFEKSADADFSMNDDASSDAPAVEEPAESLTSALTDVEENAEISDNVESAIEKSPEFNPTESEEKIAPVEGFVPTTHMDFSDEEDLPKSDDDFVLNLDETAPTEESVAEKTVAEESVVSEEPVAEEPVAEEVDGAFDALFGDDEAPAEQPKESAPDEDVAKEMGGAFASMFGDDDDLALPEEKSDSAPSEVVEKSAEEPLSQEATSAEIEESVVKEDVEKSVDESFDSIFGSDADDLPEEKTEAAEVPAEVAAEEPTSAFSAPADTLEEPVAEEPAAEPAEQVAEEVAPSAELDSIDSEVSNAFKGLFDEDDSLPESDEPNNNGVDYLMSGDSDDEVAASLVENADAPLSRGAADLDDSLNTRTLADIYMEQGVYDKALDIYTDLAKKNPDNEEIKSRLEEVKKLCREKFGEV